MKPAPFAYHAPATLEEAVSLAAELGDEARPLAGGQSLLPLMNLRLAHPTALIDLNRAEGLDRIDANGDLRLGCMVRHAAICRSAEVRAKAPMLAEAMQLVGHPAIRNRGTLGGSLAHADPAAEAPLAAVALDAELVLASAAGRRSVPAGEFFAGPFMTAIGDGELLVETVFPATDERGWGFRQVARAHGDFALVSAAAALRVDDGRARDVRIVVGGASDRPLRMTEAEGRLEGGSLDSESIAAAADAVRETLNPRGDSHASADYRRDVAGVLTTRALEDAQRRAQREE
jgi:aerobic carbon-monoxide dehydrogenase medium subunit